MEYLKEHFGFIATVVGASIVSTLTSAKHSLRHAIIRTLAGMFVAWIATDPFIDWMHLPPETYRNCVAGLLAMTGYGIVRAINNITKDDIFNFIKVLRGGK